MLIINAFLRFTSVTHQRVRSYFSSERQVSNEASESTGLLSARPSLTDHYEDFYHSFDAIWVCFFHAVVYYTIAGVGFSFLVEKWPIIDSLYFATTIFTTVGFGDLHPTSHAGEYLAIVLALYGIIILGIFIGILGEAIVESRNKTMEAHSEKVFAGVTDALSKADTPEVVEELREKTEKEKSLPDEIFSILMLEAPLVSIIVVLALIIGHIEGWPVLGSLYWLVVTATTIGFGDYTPSTPAMRLACCFFLPLAVAVFGEVLARIASAYMSRANEKSKQRLLCRSLTLCDLKTMDVNHDDRVDHAEFLTYMLVSLQKVTKEEMDELSTLFRRLDKNSGDGFLTKQDLVKRDFQGSFRKSIKTMKMQLSMPDDDYECA